MVADADADAVALLLGNLLRNACEHGSGPVRVRVGPGATVEMANPVVPGAAFVEGRFASGPGSAGSGLGLAIARDGGRPGAGAGGVRERGVARRGGQCLRRGLTPAGVPGVAGIFVCDGMLFARCGTCEPPSDAAYKGQVPVQPSLSPEAR